jgi:TonB-linked SusC/RagA family outer membrane protein
VVSDINGRYSINVPNKNAVLVFSFVGYTAQEIATGDQTDIGVMLKEAISAIDEVVVVGYGTTKKATVSGSISTLKGEEMANSPVTNASGALAGRIPGLVAYQRSGEPGSDGTTMRIRGVNSLGNNDPLVVVDGVPGRSLDRIDPTTIETISVLKDASAAIYGARAANGVILVTTKRGSQGKPTITVNFNQGFNQATRIPKMANAAEYATMLNEIDVYGGKAPRYTLEEIQKYADGSDPWKYPNTDYYKEVMKTWSVQNSLNASLAGGGESVKYYVALGSRYQDGYYKNSGTSYRQYNFRSNLDARVSKNINLSFDFAGRLENRNYPTRSLGAIFRMLQRGKPNMAGYWPNGLPGPDIEYGDNPVVVSTDATGYDRTKRYVFDSNIKLDVKIPWVQGLSVTGTASIDKSFEFRKIFQKPWYLYTWDEKTYGSDGLPVLTRARKGYDDPRLEERMSDGMSILINALLNYERNFDRHGIKFLAGIERIEANGDNFSAYRRYFISTAIDQMFAGGDNEKNALGSGYENARLNYFGRINYNYAEKLLLEFVWRYDGSYIFPEGKRYGFFPGVSVGYRLSEEEFWKNSLPAINRFKVRASWGQTGNDRIDEWQYLASYALDEKKSVIFGTDQENKLLSEQAIPNPAVTWEVANQADIGFDGAMLDGRLYFEFDVFDNRRNNILWPRNASVPKSTGMTLPRENIGKVQNRGFDFLIGYQDRLGDFRYDVSVNGGYAKNKITFWDEAPGRPDYQRSTGKPTPSNTSNPDNDLYYQKIGIFSDPQSIADYPHWNNARPGDIMFEDVNGDKKIDANDRVRSEKNNVPRFVGGLNIKLAYRQFDLSALFQGATGAVVYIYTESGNDGNFTKSYYDERWTETNPNSTGPRTNVSTNEYWLNGRNTHFLYNTDYFRLKNLELGYSLPASVNSKIGINGLRIYVSGFNLFTFSPGIKDYDPEIGEERGRYYTPQRVVNLGVSLNF